MGMVAKIWRHPIKSHGREVVERTTLVAGEAMPWDRTWAVTHDFTKHNPSNGWIMCRNFMIGTRTPALAGIWAELDEATETITLTHRDLGTLTIQPDAPAASEELANWTSPLINAGAPQPKSLVRTRGGRGWTDTDFASVSLMNFASHAAVEKKLGQALEIERWRGNFWLEGLEPWEEESWLGKDVRLGHARLRICEPIVRCMHTSANPVSGVRDADTLGALENGWGHKNFGVYAKVIEGGEVSTGDTLEVL